MCKCKCLVNKLFITLGNIVFKHNVYEQNRKRNIIMKQECNYSEVNTCLCINGSRPPSHNDVFRLDFRLSFIFEKSLLGVVVVLPSLFSDAGNKQFRKIATTNFI